MKPLTTIALIGLAVLTGAAAKPSTQWQAFAACAAAYRVNAALPDPDRPASMKAQISETADDYKSAAIKRFPKGPRADDASVKATVDGYIRARLPGFGKQTRAQVEKFIDACPQTED